ncbi:MAG: S49 family peptidase [Sutterella sp.]|nr:S49 family peptidase [Sutterella sp.]
MLFRILRRLYLALDTTRRVTANILFAFVMLLVIGLIWYGFRTPSIPSSSILEIDINGKVVMQPSALVGGRNWVAKMTGTRVEETTVSDVTDALRAARSDRRIKAVLLRLDHMTGAGPASIYEIGKAIKDYEASGHKVYAWSDSFTQAQWGIASNASEIYLHPMGEVKVRGLEATSFYLGSVLNKLGVTVNVAKAGAYKSAPEMFTNSAPSEDALTAQRFWLNDEWAQLSAAMETGRGLPQGYLKAWMDNYLENLRRAGGDAARMAKETGLVNGIANWNDLRSRLVGHDCFSGACGASSAFER